VRNHARSVLAGDFVVVVTATFRVFCVFVDLNVIVVAPDAARDIVLQCVVDRIGFVSMAVAAGSNRKSRVTGVVLAQPAQYSETPGPRFHVPQNQAVVTGVVRPRATLGTSLRQRNAGGGRRK
jgi:hypothetical protein